MIVRKLATAFLILGIIVYAPLFRQTGVPWPTLLGYMLADTANYAVLVLNLLIVAWLYKWYTSRP